jgi:processive 1,2-diacylglycerol beta-glucosyltransferase
MRVLILSCDTGEGHNSAGKAVKEYIEQQDDEAVMLDMMLLNGRKTSRVVGGAYVKLVKYFPHVFGFVYRLGRMISSKNRKSPVYYMCSLLGKKLKAYLDENDFDVIVTPHLYPAETLTYLKKKGWLTQKVAAIATDYTCIPFWEETDCDYYVLGHEELIDEFEQRGVPREKLLGWGIPVRPCFLENIDKTQARKRCGLSEKLKIYLVMGGSMGFGKIQLFVMGLASQLGSDEGIVVICGSNQKLEKRLRKELHGKKNVRILGFTNQVSDYMAACDVIFTKPGGLSSTEAAVRRIPMVHTSPIPGCENHNLDFFQSRGMSVGRKSFLGQLRAGRKLTAKEKSAAEMMKAQKENARPDAVKRIYELLCRLSEAGNQEE